MSFKNIYEEQRIMGGVADELTIEDLAKKHNVSLESIESEMAMGMKVEMEHTDDEAVAHEIAMDHLFELPDYYTRLDKMENE